MSFELTVLGSGAAVPTAKRSPSSHYLNCNERHILIDCGEGTQNQLRKFNIKIQKIKYILISHLHGDHFFGLIGLLSTMNLLGRTKGITLFAPPDLKEIIDIQLKASGYKYEFDIVFIPLEKKEYHLIFEDRKIEIFAFPLKHKISTFGFLIKEKKKEYAIIGDELKKNNVSLQAIPFFRKGEDYISEDGVVYRADQYTLTPKKSKSYAYCSDTLFVEKNIPLLRNVDLLYHEATFVEKDKQRAKQTFHSTASQAAEFAKRAKVKKLILGHFSSRYLDEKLHLKEARDIFDNTELVEDGMKFIV